MSYQKARNKRREGVTEIGRFRGGKLAPVCAVPVRPSESGLLSQTVTLELDPIAGRMVTPITGELYSVFVPAQAIDAIKDPEAAYAGMTEVLREKYLSGNPLYGLEPEGEISMRCTIKPKSIGGVKKVCESIRLGHNAAVNYLRQRKYVKATTIPASNTAVTPALIGQTVLERMNGVLDPDDRVNGAVQFDLQMMSAPVADAQTLPVRGLYFETAEGSSSPALSSTVDGAAASGISRSLRAKVTSSGTVKGNPAPSVDFPALAANLTGLDIGAISLVDFYNAQKMDSLTRAMRQMVDDNPEYGEEMVLRWAHGLSVDTGKNCFVIAEQRKIFGRNIVGALDTAGVQDDVQRSDMMLQLSFSVPIPKTELGGVIVTFCVLKPDETISAQPHPILADVWGADNYVADELALDPVPVTFRELDSNCAPALENTVAMYTGLNSLKRAYSTYGLCRWLDPTTVENKTAIWQLEIPMSVTPDNILYPEELDHYPFADQLAEVCTYVVSSAAVFDTPMIFGPTPVEELAIIGDENLFEGDE